jgi:hypothetical protein
MISRLALLENAQESRKSIDSLIAILRYMDNNNETMSTVSMELAIASKMFYLFSQKKRESFNGIILNKDIPDRCYIKKGSVLELIQVALNKKMKSNQKQLEIKVVTKFNHDNMDIVIQDNGQVSKNLEDEDLVSIYNTISNNSNENEIRVDMKKGVGTKVIITIPTVN